MCFGSSKQTFCAAVRMAKVVRITNHFSFVLLTALTIPNRGVLTTSNWSEYFMLHLLNEPDVSGKFNILIIFHSNDGEGGGDGDEKMIRRK